MTGRLHLDAAILDVMRAEAALGPLLAELAAAARHGNPDRIGAVANDAQVVGDRLADALSRVFARAGEVSAAMFDKSRSGVTHVSAGHEGELAQSLR